MAKMKWRRMDKEEIKKDEEEKRIKKSQKEGWEDRYQQPIRFEGGWRHPGATDQKLSHKRYAFVLFVGSAQTHIEP
jgi:hypothetical protein